VSKKKTSNARMFTITGRSTVSRTVELAAEDLPQPVVIQEDEHVPAGGELHDPVDGAI
jgi:hypothetical protein